MHISLRCSDCGDTRPVAFESLYSLWKEKYDKLDEALKRQVKLHTDVNCHCGNNDIYNTKMFRYAFLLIFEAFRNQNFAE